VEANQYQVLPLDASFATRAVAPRPSRAAGRAQFTRSGPATGTPNGDAPSILDWSYAFKAEVEIPQGGADGMIVTQGGGGRTRSPHCPITRPVASIF
jgi:arylsulfatase